MEEQRVSKENISSLIYSVPRFGRYHYMESMLVHSSRLCQKNMCISKFCVTELMVVVKVWLYWCFNCDLVFFPFFPLKVHSVCFAYLKSTLLSCDYVKASMYENQISGKNLTLLCLIPNFSTLDNTLSSKLHYSGCKKVAGQKGTSLKLLTRAIIMWIPPWCMWDRENGQCSSYMDSYRENFHGLKSIIKLNQN